MKQCSKCNQWLDLSCFYIEKGKLRANCKDCFSLYSKQNYINNKEKKRNYNDQWRKNNQEKVTDYNKHYWQKNKNNPKNLFSFYKGDTKRKKRIFEINFEQFVTITNKNCFYCGSMNDTRRNGIDRKDSGLGYVIENCVSCCYMCNTMKLDYSENEFYKKIIDIYNNLNLKDFK
jgi:hypothetical protein